jgi:hypothetical protein
VKNKGFEISLGYNKAIGRDWSLGITANGAYSRNKVIYLSEVLLPQEYAYRLRSTGYRLGQPFGYETAGFFNSQEEIEEWYDQTPLGSAPKPGDLKYVDKNNDDKVDERDMSPIGNPNVPDWTFGGAIQIRWKLFDLSMMFQGSAGSSYYLNGIGIWETDNFSEWHKEAWTAEKYADGKKITYPRLDPGSTASKQTSDFWMANGSYIRLKNAEFGITLPGKIAERIGASRIRIYANGLNLLTFDNYPVKYYDPEQNSNYVYPLFKAYNVGLNVSF